MTSGARRKWSIRPPREDLAPERREGPVLLGQRVTLRALEPSDYEDWFAVRSSCRAWLQVWEPRPDGGQHLAEDRASFVSRCGGRDRERQLGYGYGFGIFVDERFCGEITLSSIQRGPFQSGVIGYWIDQAVAGNGLMPESVVAVLAFAFERLGLHRVEINIVPRNAASRRVVEKLDLRLEGTSQKMLQIDGVWEDHMRFAITVEEWRERRADLLAAWS